jgi:membrane fusion protein (multidrug efflux system)
MRPTILSLSLSLAALSCAAEHATVADTTTVSPVRSVHVALAREIRQPVSDQVVGSTRAKNAASISASLMGKVRAIHVVLGATVRANQVLIVLSADEIDAKANQARAQFEQAGVELRRVQLLRDSQSVPIAHYDSALARYRVAEAVLAEAEVMRGYRTLRAPFAGVITAKHCDLGDTVMPDEPLLTLQSANALRFEAAVPEAIAGAVRPGAAMRVRIDTLGQELTGHVSELSPSADPASRTVLIKLDLPPTSVIRSGMFGRISVPTGEERAVVVPSSALVQHGQIEALFVVEEGRAQLRLVRSGRTRDGHTEVLSGLERGEPVVVAEARQLSDADPVRVLP